MLSAANLTKNKFPLLISILPVAALVAITMSTTPHYVSPAHAQQPAAAAAMPPPPPIALPDFDLVTNLETPPQPTRGKPARPGRVFDGPVTRGGAAAAWKGGSLVAFYDYGVNCGLKVEPLCNALGVATLPDPSGFADEHTVADPADPKFIAAFGRRIGRLIDQLQPRAKQPLAAHIDNLGLVSDLVALRAIYGAARTEYERRKLRPLFVVKNNMRSHEALFAEGTVKPEEAAYIICENCLTKAGGAEFEAGIRLAGALRRPIVLIEFGKAKMGWQNATLQQSEGLAARLTQEKLRGFAYWGPDEDRYEFTRQFPGAPEAEARN